ncbi:unnamed protein product [Triticum turgidum subsp. durum]|uniref:J domain-containing protein n=1 Tax=Triticum turgidum subsp. durum TaxID=4567 RepID=A0A9R0S801_TRITD|nr:unnamed protein product [Triticum turgidum subsp. durum]
MDASAGAGSGNAPCAGAGASSCCYYTLLGIRKNASSTDIRAAYRRLAMKWHPDRWASDPGATGEAKRRFQRIQEAYSVLSDKGKRAMYDAGLFDPLDDDDQTTVGTGQHHLIPSHQALTTLDAIPALPEKSSKEAF